MNIPYNSLCDDGLYCDGAEICNISSDCQPGIPPDLDDGVGCTIDNCNETSDIITHTADDSYCLNDLWCDGAEYCDAVSDCQLGTAYNCDDMIACTDDSCDENIDSCVSTPNDANCDNGWFCDGTETCDALSDCQAGTPINTNDSITCTIDDCDEVNDVITHMANNSYCNDGLDCSVDACNPTNDCEYDYSACICTDSGYTCCAPGEGSGNYHPEYDSTCYDGNSCWDTCTDVPETCTDQNYMCCLAGEGLGTHYWWYDSTCYDGDSCWDSCIIIKSWSFITYPEGVYEPYAEGLAGTHLFTFNITFNNITSQNGDILECNILRSDSSLFELNKVLTDLSQAQESLTYTLQQTDPISKLTPWHIDNCTLTKNNKVLYFEEEPNTELNGSIFVHGNVWTRFNSVDDDAYRASRCFLGIPKRYFNNSYYCDFAGDVGFAVSMSRGMYVEGYCHDGIDGPEANGKIDCEDMYCRGIP